MLSYPCSMSPTNRDFFIFDFFDYFDEITQNTFLNSKHHADGNQYQCRGRDPQWIMRRTEVIQESRSVIILCKHKTEPVCYWKSDPGQ